MKKYKTLGYTKLAILKLMKSGANIYDDFNILGFPQASVRRCMSELKNKFVKKSNYKEWELIKYTGNSKCISCSSKNIVGNSEIVCLDCAVMESGLSYLSREKGIVNIED